MEYTKPLYEGKIDDIKDRIKIAHKKSPIEVNYFKEANILSVGFKTIESEKWKINPNVTHVGSFYTFTDGHGEKCIKRDGMKTVGNIELTAILQQFNGRLSIVDDELLVI